MKTESLCRSLVVIAVSAGIAFAQSRSGGELRFCLKSDPKSFHPFLVYDEPSEAVRYLTGGTLIRLNRKTQEVAPELALSWKLLAGGREMRFELRPNVRFSNGAALRVEDVAFSLKTFFDPATQAPDADSFGVDLHAVQVRSISPTSIAVTFPKPIAGMERLFDSVPIVSAAALSKVATPTEMPVLGPFRFAEYLPGSYLLLARNAYYWKSDESGVRLPYLDAVRLYIQSNSALELLRFEHGDTDLLNSVDPEAFSNLSGKHGIRAFDLGPSLDSEQLWFNEVPGSPIPQYKKEWFQSKKFRTAISSAINRGDIARIAYFSRASASAGPVSQANERWFNRSMTPPPVNAAEALRSLSADGFHLSGQALRDRHGNLVEFSVITNAGNKVRERVAALVQTDLSAIGIKLSIVPLDFPALLQRITRTSDYESCLLGLVNSDLDPSGQMNVWLSSGSNHAWNPGQPSPATGWEKEIDSLMAAQAADLDVTRRKAAFDRVQAISSEENAALYLVTKHSLTAFSDALANPSPAVLFPQAFWDADRLYFRDGSAPRKRPVARQMTAQIK